LGKPSTAGTLEVFGSHIEQGSILIHDMEKAHRKLVVELSLTEEVYNYKVISKLPDSENPLRDVNRLCYLQNVHSGFDRDNLDGYLNLFSLIMNPPANKLEKEAYSSIVPWVTPKRCVSVTSIT